jgi:recombinational DNA repair protein (RecF pathway)
MAKQCELIIGYLLPRQCEEKGVNACTRCQRVVCDLHTSMGDSGLLCRDCFENAPARTLDDVVPLVPVVHQYIYTRDYQAFDQDRADEAMGTLS